MNRFLKNAFLVALLATTAVLMSCEEDGDTTEVPAVLASFTQTIDSETGTVTFLNTSENATTYAWDFGDGTSSTLFEPSKQYSENGTFTVKLTASNNSGDEDVAQADVTIDVVVPDTEVPVITLLGDAEITINVGDTYDDAGATATDNVDGDITDAITVTGSVDVNTEGSYTLNYNVSDAAGNAAVEVSRTVIVVDNTGGGTGTSIVNFENALTGITTGQFGGGVGAELIANPVSGGINTSANVFQISYTSGSEWWGGTELDFGAGVLDASATVYKAKLYSTVANSNVLFEVETASQVGTSGEVQTVVNANEWVEVTFTIPNPPSAVNRIIIRPDVTDLNGTKGNDGILYIDDIVCENCTLGSGGGGGNCTAETSETLTATGFNWTMQTNPSANVIDDGVTFSWIDNPDFDNAVNSSCKVGQATKRGQNPWDNLQYDLADKIDFAANGGFKIKVWSGKADTKVRIKLEEVGNAGNNAELEKTMTKTSEWEELTFDFAEGQTNKFNKIVIFFDLNGNNTDTYYFDDLMLYTRTGGGGGGTGDCPAPPAGDLISNGNFEAGAACWQLLDAALTTISTTVNNGGSNSGQLQGATGKAVGLKQERFAGGTLQPGTTYTVTFDIQADGAFGEGGILKVFTFSEGVDGGNVGATQHVLADAITSVATSWEQKSYNFTTPANAPQVEGGLSFLIEIVNSSAKINIDNVSIK